MTDYKKIIKTVLIIVCAVCAIALITVAAVMIIKKVKTGMTLKRKQEQEALDESAYSDFEECCDACFSDSED